MKTQNKPTPFWVDDPQAQNFPKLTQTSKAFITIRWIISAVVYMSTFLILTFLAIIVRETLMFWFILGLYLLFVVVSVYSKLRRRASISLVREIQENARRLVDATQIGSAIHVAGHPVLDRDQPVVLALDDQRLSIYSYESSTPLDVIQIAEIVAAQPVVYDDERVPHMDIIDSAAQALQIIYQRNHETWTCLFRRMRGVRPLDWFHALQKARYQELGEQQ